MANTNKGKKYVKLRGGEIATPENEARAREFMDWYAANERTIRTKLIYESLYDDQIATDTMLNVYDAIAYKGLRVQDYKFYFLRAYHTNRIAARKRSVPVESIDAPARQGETPTIADTLAAPEFNYEAYERTVDAFKTEITEYVRANYGPAECSIFEIYIALQPEISYPKMSRMLGIPSHRLWMAIGQIKKDLLKTFARRKDNLLSAL